MWSYRPAWQNRVQQVEHTNSGGSATVYNLNLFSHSGTYIETSQHKLNNNILLSDFSITKFYIEVKVLIINEPSIITKLAIIKELKENNFKINQGDNLIIANGYGVNHKKENYLTNSPSFEPTLTDWLTHYDLSLLGTDTPIIDNLELPYAPVVKLFESNPNMLLLAPLFIDTNIVKTGIYKLFCLPLKVENTSGMLCRPVLIK